MPVLWSQTQRGVMRWTSDVILIHLIWVCQLIAAIFVDGFIFQRISETPADKKSQNSIPLLYLFLVFLLVVVIVIEICAFAAASITSVGYLRIQATKVLWIFVPLVLYAVFFLDQENMSWRYFFSAVPCVVPYLVGLIYAIVIMIRGWKTVPTKGTYERERLLPASA